MQNKYEKLAEIEAVTMAMLGRKTQNALSPRPRALDISKANEHDSKKEFTEELKAVEAGLKYTDSMIKLFVIRDEQGKHTLQNKRMTARIDKIVRQDVDRMLVENQFDLIHVNMGKVGYSVGLLMTLLRTSQAFDERLSQLQDQEEEFWSLGHRAPNYYARTISLRLARIYCLETGGKPTFGTASDGGHPSTAFAKAVEQIFDILGIGCDIRGPIEWALMQIDENDFVPRRDALQDYLPKPKPHSESAVVDAFLGANKPSE